MTLLTINIFSKKKVELKRVELTPPPEKKKKKTEIYGAEDLPGEVVLLRTCPAALNIHGVCVVKILHFLS